MIANIFTLLGGALFGFGLYLCTHKPRICSEEPEEFNEEHPTANPGPIPKPPSDCSLCGGTYELVEGDLWAPCPWCCWREDRGEVA